MRNIPAIEKFRNRLSLPVGHLLIGQRTGDKFLASFPRSGSTWLRTILVNLLVPGANSDPEVFNRAIPGVSIRNAPVIRRLATPRIIHTHSCYRPEIHQAVYTVRDGRDAIVSFYHYLTTRRGVNLSFPDWFGRYERHIYGATWDEHVRSWLGSARQRMGKQLLIVQFERLKSHPEEVVREICVHLRINAAEADVRTAIRMASIDNARRIERRRLGERASGDASFYRGGRSGQWRNYLSGPVGDAFWQRSKAAMQLAGYGD